MPGAPQVSAQGVLVVGRLASNPMPQQAGAAEYNRREDNEEDACSPEAVVRHGSTLLVAIRVRSSTPHRGQSGTPAKNLKLRSVDDDPKTVVVRDVGRIGGFEAARDLRGRFARGSAQASASQIRVAGIRDVQRTPPDTRMRGPLDGAVPRRLHTGRRQGRREGLQRGCARTDCIPHRRFDERPKRTGSPCRIGEQVPKRRVLRVAPPRLLRRRPVPAPLDDYHVTLEGQDVSSLQPRSSTRRARQND
jgi:hypothetical protein